MRLTIYRMWRGNNDYTRSGNSRSTRSQSPPPYLDTSYGSFGGARHGFNSPSNVDRSFAEPAHSFRLPPIAAMGAAASILPSFLDQPAQPQTSDGARRPEDDTVQSSGTAVEDTEMTTPDPSRRPSQNDQASTPRANSQPHICSCTRDERMTESPSLIGLATAAYNIARPYSRLPVQDFLNHSPPHETHTPQTQTQTSTSANAGSGSKSDYDHPMITPPRSTPSISSISSDSTLRPPFNAAVERSYLLNTLYHICLDATATFLNSKLPATRHRHNQLPRHRARYHPYRSRGTCLPGRSSIPNPNPRRRNLTLMDNIRDISTWLWRTARSNNMAPHRAEVNAVRSMRDLYAWGEIVATGMESDWVNVERGHGSDEDEEEFNENGILGMKVGYAASKLCCWLGDGEAWDACQGVMEDLKGLDGEVDVGGRVDEVEEESEDGNIT